jgi:hypothetical protein
MDRFNPSQIQGYLVGQVIAASVGVLLLLVGDFGGFSYYDRYYGWRTGYVFIGSEYPGFVVRFLSTIVILLAVGGLLVALQASIKSIQAKEASPRSLEENAIKAVKGGGFAAAVAFLGAVVFALFSTLQEMEWWLDSGFYGAFLGGLLTVFFGKTILNKIKFE